MSQSEPAWSDWRPLTGWSPALGVLTETLDGGQSFAWFREPKPSTLHSLGNGGSSNLQSMPDCVWTGRWCSHVVQLHFASGALQWRGLPGTTAAMLHHYIGSETDWTVLTDTLPWRSDAHLAQCLAAFPSLRILRQPFGETLLGFLCSATKQIAQIKQMIALLAERHGATIAPGHRRLPTWEELAKIPETELRGCLLGFRARYISDTAKFLARHPGWLDETEQLPYAAAKARLIELPGVGEKVADCVLLFGAGRLEAFPVDTWVLKSLARRYGLTGWKPAPVAHFGRTHFGPLAGLAQQYLFAWERRHGGR